jgi:RNA polymerase sigma-70 factor (ECF subfamily)
MFSLTTIVPILVLLVSVFAVLIEKHRPRRELSDEFAATSVLRSSLDCGDRRRALCHDQTVTQSTLKLARRGDEEAFQALTDPYRRELQVHCYRIMGSVQDAEDMVQETLLAAWRALERYEERDSMRAWLYRIATNRCLNALRDTRRRPREAPALPFEVPEPTRRGETLWLEPYPDTLLEGVPETAPGPDARYETKEAVTLAFVAALQHLPPRQRAVLVLRDVLGFHAAEVAEMLDTSEVSVNSALQRARGALETRPPDRERARLPRSPGERELVARFANAVEGGDVDGMVALLTDDALLTMPPLPLEYEGHEAIAAFLRSREEDRGRPLRVVPTRANTQPAFGCYLPDAQGAVAHPRGLFVLTLEGDAVTAITWFTDNALFPHFGLSPVLG